MSGLIATILNAIAGFFANVGQTFWDFYIRTSGDFFFGWTASWWRAIGGFFDELAFAFILFRNVLMGIADEIATFLTGWDILDLMKGVAEWALDAWNWVSSAWSNVWQIVNAWWGTIITDVLGWIDAAIDVVNSVIASIQFMVNVAASWIGQFVATTLPTLATIFTVETLVDSTIRTWFPFYDELVSIWNEILEFFADPPQYVYNKLDEFFERFW